jgi:hypothetical protein
LMLPTRSCWIKTIIIVRLDLKENYF